VLLNLIVSTFSLLLSEYDTFGFKTVPEEDEEEERLFAKVRALELKSLSMTDQEVSVGVKWENYLASIMNRDPVRSPELKGLFRYGVPHEHRSLVWRWCVSFHVKKFRDNLAPDYYETLLNVARDKPNPASKQIELDLLRTLPNNKHYSSPSAGGIQKLRNVLMAFSWRNPDIGYCQGLNRYRGVLGSLPLSVCPSLPFNYSFLFHLVHSGWQLSPCSIWTKRMPSGAL